MNPMQCSQKGIIVSEHSDLDKVFEFSKLMIEEMFRELFAKGNTHSKIELDIYYREVKG